MKQHMHLRPPGFSLVELMTVLAILGLLVTVAWPSYQSHVRRAYRAQAQAALLEAQHFMERHYAAYGRYTTAAAGAPTLPARLQAVPDQAELRYRILLESVDAASFTLRAEPQGALSADPCGSLTLTSTGLKGRSGVGLSVQQCWQ